MSGTDMCSGVWACVRVEVDTGCSPWWLSTLCIEAASFVEH